MDEFDRARAQIVARIAARMAEAVRVGDGELLDLSADLLNPRRRRRAAAVVDPPAMPPDVPAAPSVDLWSSPPSST